MSTKLVVGVDGAVSGDRAIAHAKHLAKLIGDCELILLYVIEWSPYSFQTAEENAVRHKRREEEIEAATTRVVEPAVASLKADGFSVTGLVRHGDVAELLNRVATDAGAAQIIVARVSETGVMTRLFGSSTANLVMSATVPVTVVS